jgi:hypothetical protein
MVPSNHHRNPVIFSPVLTKESTHLLIHTASETVEHRTGAVFEFFDATASVSGAMMEGRNGKG